MHISGELKSQFSSSPVPLHGKLVFGDIQCQQNCSSSSSCKSKDVVMVVVVMLMMVANFRFGIQSLDFYLTC